MLAAQLALLLGLLVLCSFAPGFYFVRRFRWTPLEKLCGSVGLSLTLLYLASWGVFVLTSGSPSAYYFAISAACAAAAIASRRDMVRLSQAPQVRYGVAGFGFLLLWSLLILAMIRNYSGADWRGDWLEHFQRSLFFLKRFPASTLFLNRYELPARPPLMNVLASFFLGQTADRFEVFQIVFLFLNLLVFLPSLLIVPALGLRRSRSSKSMVLPLVAIFAMSPVLTQNVTFTWTKALTAFYVVLGLWFYLAANRKKDPVRMLAAFLALSAGLLTHYSAGPYVVFLAMHYLFVTFRKCRRKLGELASIAALCSLLLFTWFGWSLLTYGAHATFASNTSVTSTEKYQGSNLEKIAANLFDTIVPGIVRDPSIVHAFEQPNYAGFIRDNVFILYQANLVLGMGITGGALLFWLFDVAARRRKDGGPERSFWLLLVPCVVLLGVVVVGHRDILGVAHLTLLPVEVLGLTWLASVFWSRRILTYVILAGLVVDFSLGVFLQARVENLDNNLNHTYFTGLSYTNGQFVLGEPGPASFTLIAWENWLQKHKVTLCREWLSELDEQHSGSEFVGTVRPIRAHIQSVLDEDVTLWQGWYSRHGGSISFFGDAFGTAWAPACLLLALWIGLLWVLWHHLPPYAPACAETAPYGNAGIACGFVLASSAVCLVQKTVEYFSGGKLAAGVVALLVASVTTFSAGFVISHTSLDD